MCLGIVSAEHEQKENCLAPSPLSSHSTTARGKDDQEFILEACIPADAFFDLPRSVPCEPPRPDKERNARRPSILQEAKERES